MRVCILVNVLPDVADIFIAISCARPGSSALNALDAGSCRNDAS